MPKKSAQLQNGQLTEDRGIKYKRYAISLPENIRQLAKKIEKKERRSFSNLLAILIENYAIKSGYSKIDKTQ
ncbi:MAG: hypothetical protein AB7S75_14315 [Desulfococcaceae bacterium]